MEKDFSDLTESKFQKVIDFLKKELKKIHAGRASIELIEDIIVEAYGTKNRLKNLSALSLAGPKEILIELWDKNILKDVETAVLKAPLSLQVIKTQDQKLIVKFPSLTNESRQNLIKLLNEKKEKARILIRQEREKILKELEEKFEKKEISEDEKFKLKKELQKSTEDFNKKIEELCKAKEKEILET